MFCNLKSTGQFLIVVIADLMVMLCPRCISAGGGIRLFVIDVNVYHLGEDGVAEFLFYRITISSF